MGGNATRDPDVEHGLRLVGELLAFIERLGDRVDALGELLGERVDELEVQVEDLRAELDRLRRRAA